ncbi:MAG: alanine dehydrogenase [Desulfuromonadaceae bacterium]|nr:alanine dehydrogenase [Desulfuromonadaceae bacterium]
MVIGVPREIKVREYRVGMTPAGVHALVEDGHTVLLEKGAGEASGIGDQDYLHAGAGIIDSAAQLYAESELIAKVKEPLPQEYPFFREGQMLFAYLHLAPNPDLTRFLLERRITGIAYETVQLDDGSLPLLFPMSLIAGRMAVQVGAHFLEKENGGKGLLLSGAPGVPPGKVVVLGGGAVGENAARLAVGAKADVTLVDINLKKLTLLDEQYEGRLKTLFSTPFNVREAVAAADLVIGAVLIPGGKTPHLVTKEMVAEMTPGSVIVDVSIDQGGCVETIHPTTHEHPVYEVNGVLHYGVTNIPGAVCRTSTFALTNTTLPYLRKLAAGGFDALLGDRAFLLGLNTHAGKVRHTAVAEALDLPCEPLAG